jgi:hypothetical protein
MPGNGSITGMTQLLDNGPRSERFNIVLVGDGFQLGTDTQLWQDTAAEFLTALQGEDWYGLTNHSLNLFRGDVWSTDSGVANPAQPNQKTYFDGYTDNTTGTITVDLMTAGAVATQLVTEWHTCVVLFNDSLTAGGGIGVSQERLPMAATSHAITWASRHLIRNPDNSAGAIFHELGHSMFGLGDEYGCQRGGPCSPYGVTEPPEANLTIATTRDQLKWKFWVLDETPIPTARRAAADCTSLAELPNPLGAGHEFTIGLFEGGAHQHQCGIFHPAHTCKMHTNFGRFCAVCQAAVQDVTNPFWSPIPCPIDALFGPPPAPPGPAMMRERLRAFRDAELRTRAVGREYLRLMRAHTAELLALLAKHTALRDRVLALVQRVADLLARKRAPDVDGALVDEAAAIMDALARLGGPALRRTIAELHGHLDHFRDVALRKGVSRAERAWRKR